MSTKNQEDYPELNRTNWDVIVIGSGFGGSVSALRLVEKGYKDSYPCRRYGRK